MLIITKPMVIGRDIGADFLSLEEFQERSQSERKVYAHSPSSKLMAITGNKRSFYYLAKSSRGCSSGSAALSSQRINPGDQEKNSTIFS